LSSGGISPPVIYETRYWYDEAGNRIHKLVKRYNGVEQNPIYIENDDPFGLWETITDEYYVRDVSGKEMAIYQGTTLDFWNIWGMDNIGKINANGSRFFYLKDHLGTVRAVVNQINDLVSAQDYDMWGYPMENRSFTNGRISFSKTYEFTSKERDDESNYDYFGARYYDARIGRWGGVEPLLDKFVSWSSYVYSVDRPIVLYDPNGTTVRFSSNSTERASAFQTLTRSLEPELKEYLKVIQDNNGDYVLDKELLESARKDFNELPYDFERLSEVSQSIKVADIIPVKSGTYIKCTNTETGKPDKILLSNEGNVGYTLPSGFEGDNKYPAKFISTSGNIEIYFINDNDEEASVTLAEEVDVHAADYVTNREWRHPAVDMEAAIVRDVARANYNEHQK
jgi:RHS repeat-associated protein